MKKLFFLVFAIGLLACSCQKESCNIATIEIKNNGTSPVMVYSIESHPVIQPGESIGQPVEFCQGTDFNGFACEDSKQESILFKFDDGEMQSKGAMVYRCETTIIEVSN